MNESTRFFMSDIAYTQNNIDQGELKIHVTARGSNRPITNARVAISYSGDPDSIVEEVNTDASGMSEQITLPAPPLEFSMEPGEEQPFSQYSIQVDAEGFRPFTVSGIELFSKQLSLQEVRMDEVDAPGNPVDTIVIPVNTLWGDFPPKIAESEIKPISETGEIVLSRVVVPEYVVVHDGPPNDTTARDYYVRYKDYIKNVASSEIYSTWPDATLRANILAIMSFTLNRVYTEWYRNKGYSFTITSSTAYDQKFIYGRNIYSNIDRLVDSIFANYLSRPGVRQPIFTSYCDGNRVSCQGLSQWGSKYLGDQGYSAIEIIRYYYGNDMYINAAQAISGVPSSWPGYDLTIGASGTKVRQIQEQLNRIAQNYPAIPKTSADGIFGSQTAAQVRAFQRIFNLPATGIVDYPTWYQISNIYVAVSRIAEPGT